MNYSIALLFSPIFWISAVTVLLLLVAFTFKWRVRLGSFRQKTEAKESGRSGWIAGLASAPYWFLAFLAFLFVIAEVENGFDPKSLLIGGVIFLVSGVAGFAIVKRNYVGYLLGLTLSFIVTLGFLIFGFYAVQFPCEGGGRVFRSCVSICWVYCLYVDRDFHNFSFHFFIV